MQASSVTQGVQPDGEALSSSLPPENARTSGRRDIESGLRI
jgi:hypothetical protein